jgi:ubiquinone/menaquinone biosynthesis C-methylase UbiE/uncharacterized protein YbaR (Trm112 family)
VADITQLIRCPLTHGDLHKLNEAEIAETNARISACQLFHLDGSLVELPLEEAYKSSAGGFVYPVVDGITILLAHLAIVMDPGEASYFSQEFSEEKRLVMDFYDQTGWQRTEGEAYKDAARFEDLRPVSRDYIHRCHLRLKRYFASQGNYLLDVASGPIQYPEYLEYSQGFERRICADISFVALKEAKKHLGNKGIYLLCDVTNLPLKDQVVDAFVSLHTIYHVPAGDQLTAIRELHRVLRKDKQGVIVYSWGRNSLMMKMLYNPTAVIIKAMMSVRRRIPAWLKGIIKRVQGKPSATRQTNGKSSPASAASTQSVRRPYMFAHDYGWYQANIASSFQCQLVPWRSVNVPFLRAYIHRRILGKQILSILFRLEDAFPRFFARYGQYPVFILEKK